MTDELLARYFQMEVDEEYLELERQLFPDAVGSNAEGEKDLAQPQKSQTLGRGRAASVGKCQPLRVASAPQFLQSAYALRCPSMLSAAILSVLILSATILAAAGAKLLRVPVASNQGQTPTGGPTSLTQGGLRVSLKHHQHRARGSDRAQCSGSLPVVRARVFACVLLCVWDSMHSGVWIR